MKSQVCKACFALDLRYREMDEMSLKKSPNPIGKNEKFSDE